jgi:hypothetical protein
MTNALLISGIIFCVILMIAYTIYIMPFDYETFRKMFDELPPDEQKKIMDKVHKMAAKRGIKLDADNVSNPHAEPEKEPVTSRYTTPNSKLVKLFEPLLPLITKNEFLWINFMRFLWWIADDETKAQMQAKFDEILNRDKKDP